MPLFRKMISDVELQQLEMMTSMMHGMELNHSVSRQPLPPDMLMSNTGQEIRYFHSPHQGFHNWFRSRFVLLGHVFYTVEQYAAWQKACFFGDHEMALQILACMNPMKVRRLAQRLRNFNLEQWRNVRDKIIYEGLRAKFTQNAMLFDQLRDTGSAMITEASIANPYWTCGVSARNLQRLKCIDQWDGENTLGRLLMRLREYLNERYFW